jgi:hypothetical protein
LVRHYQEKSGDVSENLLPEKIDDLVDQMGHFIEVRLTEDTPYKNVWDDFVNQPEENASYLSGVLEPLFEAQPAVRERVDGFMQQITAIEVERSDHARTEAGIESDLQSEPGGLTPDEGKSSAILADKKVEKNPPAYLYGNERQNYESARQAPVPKPFMIGENAQIVFLSDEDVPFPRLLDYFAELVDTSTDIKEDSKQLIQEQLETIYLQLSGERHYDEDELAQSFQAIWEEAPSHADALISSLQNDVDRLPVEARDFIVQLHTPLK